MTSRRVAADDMNEMCGAKGNRTPDLLDANESKYADLGVC